MKTRKIEFLPSASQSLRALFAYISKDKKQAALNMVDKIEKRIMRLADSPYLGLELSSDAYPTLEPGCRRLVVAPYVIFYRVLEDSIVIVHVIHGRRDVGRALTEPGDSDDHLWSDC